MSNSEILTKISSAIGAQQVLTGNDAAPYGLDPTGGYSSQPLAVLRPADTAEVSEILKLANAAGAPIVPVGGNTGLVGGTYAQGSLMMSLERLNKILNIKPTARTITVQSGATLSKIHEAAEEHELAFPLFFAARGTAMIGGALSTNAGGSNVLRYGNTRAMCLGLEVVMADGTVMNLMSELHKDNTGYDLKDLFIGAEGTLGIITGAVMKLVPLPKAYATAMVAAKSLTAALELLNRLQEATGGAVEAFEYMPRSYMRQLKKVRPDLSPPLGHDQDCTILVELGAISPRDYTTNPDGSVPIVELLNSSLAELIEAGLATNAAVALSNRERQEYWAVREAAAEISFARKPYVDNDIAVPLDKVSQFVELVSGELTDLDPNAETITVAHLGDGNLHYTVWPSANSEQLHDNIRKMVDALAIRLGGSFSAEHGIGLTKVATLARGKDAAAFVAMGSIKNALDPNGILNPGKVLS